MKKDELKSELKKKGNENAKIHLEDDRKQIAKLFIKWHKNFYRKASLRLYTSGLLAEAIAHPNFIWFILADLQICELASQVATFKVSVPATNAYCERGLGRLGR